MELLNKMSTTIWVPVFLATIGLLCGLSMACDSNLPTNRKWAHDWDKPMEFSCNNDQPIKSLYSYWLSCKRDRVWSFRCGTVGKANTVKSCHGWTLELNEWDGPLFKMCPDDGYVNGLSSVHDNGKEDRRFKMRCCSSRKHKTCNCYTEDLNDFQHVLDYTVPEGKVLRGLYSYHRNDKEDRAWTAIICSLRRK